MNVFDKFSFDGGLNRLRAADRLGPSEYRMLSNGRIRTGAVTPTNKHLKIKLPAPGHIQCVFAQGGTLFVFIGGVAYYADDIDASRPINLRPVNNWVAMSAEAETIWLCAVPATTNFLVRAASSVDAVTRTFNRSLARFQECIIVQDGVNAPRAILPDGNSLDLGSYDTWNEDSRIYVPVGKQMAYTRGKLFVVLPDGKLIAHSVSGRCTDFITVIDNEGAKAGDVTDNSIGVSFADITAIYGLEDGSLLASTLYGTWNVVETGAFAWGEPIYAPILLFPAGALNNRVLVNLNGDLTFLTQSSIQSFNFTQQIQNTSNNTPIGAPISSIFSSPQPANTAATNFDDYGMFGINTVDGPRTAIYDSFTKTYVALDDSFGTVTHFAQVRTAGNSLLIFSTTTDELFLAYGDTTAVNTTTIYVGDAKGTSRSTPTGAPTGAGVLVQCTGVRLHFIDYRGSGYVTIRVFTDGVVTHTETLPATSDNGMCDVSFKLSEPAKGYGIGVEVTWNGDMSLAEVGFVGDNVTQVPENQLTDTVAEEVFAMSGNIRLGEFLESTSSTVGYAYSTVVADKWYIFDPLDSDVELIDGDRRFRKRILFQSTGFTRAFSATTSDQFRLREVSAVYELFREARAQGATRFMVLGNGTSPQYLYQDVKDLQTVAANFELTLYAVPSTQENNEGWRAAQGYATPQIVLTQYTMWAMYNTTGNAELGYEPGSLQEKHVISKLSRSAKPFNFVAMYHAAYSNTDSGPELPQFALNFAAMNAHAVFAGNPAAAEMLNVNGIIYINSGRGSASEAGEIHDYHDALYTYDASECFTVLRVRPNLAEVVVVTLSGEVKQRQALHV